MLDRRGAIVAAVVLVTAVLGAGCSSPEKRAGDAAQVAPWTPSPEPGLVIARYDERTARLERLWARVTFVVEGTDPDGERFREQAEGHLQVELPSRMALSLGKLGDPRLYLGSNDTVYWWIDAVDGEDRVAAIGRHELVTGEKIERLGITVRPLDVVELLGVRTIGADAATTRVLVSADKPGIARVVVRRPSGVTVELEVEAERGEPRVITVYRDGKAAAQSALSGYIPVVVTDDRVQRPRVAQNVDIRSAGLDGVAKLRLYDPANKPIKPIVFDAARLFEAYGVDRVVDLDTP